MSWRVVVISSTAKLDYKMDYLIVRNREAVKRIHLSEISVLLIETTAVSLTAYLIYELSKRKIDIIFCDEKRCPCGVFAPMYGSHDTSLKFRNQISWSDNIKVQVWQEIVKAKLTGQAKVAEIKKNADISLLMEYRESVLPGDITNREGHAAKVYFNLLFGKSFSRETENNINAALNYGYGIMLSLFARETAAAGYSTQIGIFHDNMYNQFNLACDLMEPFRPFVDACVLDMDLTTFGHEEKMELVKLLNEKIMIDEREQYILNGARIYTQSVFSALNNEDVSLIIFPSYEL